MENVGTDRRSVGGMAYGQAMVCLSTEFEGLTQRVSIYETGKYDE